MATWKVEPTWKKSVIERMYFSKDGNRVMIETGWRSGSFYVYTEDDNPPNIEAGVDIYNCDYETEMIETWDGCWTDYDYDDCDDETQAWLEEFLEENSYFDLEEHDWVQDDSEMIIDCDLRITRINDDDSEGESFTTGTVDKETASENIEEGAKWPFDNPDETSYAKFKCESCDFLTEDITELKDNPNDDNKGAFVCPQCGGKVDLN